MTINGNQEIYEHLNTICNYIHRRKLKKNELSIIKFSYETACLTCEQYFIEQPKNLKSFVKKFLDSEERIDKLIPSDEKLNILTGLEKNTEDVNNDRFFIGLFFYICMFLKYIQKNEENINRLPDIMKKTPDELFSRIIIIGQKYNDKDKYNDYKKTTLICGLGVFFYFYGNHLRILKEEEKITEELFLKTTDVWDLLKLIEIPANVDVFTKECKPKQFKPLDYNNPLLNHFINSVFDCIFQELFTNEKISVAFAQYINDMNTIRNKIENTRPSSRFSIFTRYFIF